MFRPSTFDEYIGQDNTKMALKIKVNAFKRTGTSLGHMLFLGFSGAGKTTLANVLASEMGVRCHEVVATRINSFEDLLVLIQQVSENDLVFIDEIHNLKPKLQEELYTVMEDFEYGAVDPILQQRTTIKVPRFTLIGATTHEGLMNAAFLTRVQFMPTLSPYTYEQLARMIGGAAHKNYGIALNPQVALRLAQLSQRVARKAMNHLRNLMEMVNGVGANTPTLEHVDMMLKMNEIDPFIGLDKSTRNYLVVLEREGGAPVGLKSLATLTNKQEATITNLIEPFLASQVELPVYALRDGKWINVGPKVGPLVKITRMGRKPTDLCTDYLRQCRALQKLNAGWFASEDLG